MKKQTSIINESTVNIINAAETSETTSSFAAGAEENPSAPAGAGMTKGASPAADNGGLKVLEFCVSENLAECVDSMLFDSNTGIAYIRCKTNDGLTVAVHLDVRGEVRVGYKGQLYNKPSEFPEELRNRIKAHPGNWEYPDIDMPNLSHLSEEELDHLMELGAPDDDDDEDDLFIYFNNWFEYIWTVEGKDINQQDGIVCEDDLSKLTEEELKNEMKEVVNQVLELVRA